MSGGDSLILGRCGHLPMSEHGGYLFLQVDIEALKLVTSVMEGGYCKHDIAGTSGHLLKS